ncbi:MAG: type III-A CRISPR-associated protein Csm2 [Muribaculaceae bacterium]|nr:type III-A CRISPR-associated protein Csm2 [Muribaculaceae bacterium]
MAWNKRIQESEIRDKVTELSVAFAEEFGEYLANNEKDGPESLTTNQLRKFFGEVKRQQMAGYNEASFVMLKPKLAYAVGRAKNGKQEKQVKIEDFYNVMRPAIDSVVKAPDKEKAFKNFISIFEAIVAYHKQFEKTK